MKPIEEKAMKMKDEIENAATEYCDDQYSRSANGETYINAVSEDITDAFIAGAEWMQIKMKQAIVKNNIEWCKQCREINDLN